jgi:DNA-binding protein H-NS
MTKKQRQNAAKREAQKTAKAEAEAQRLATLAKHKQDLEKTRIVEQYSKKGGGSSASVDDKGHLVWD